MCPGGTLVERRTLPDLWVHNKTDEFGRYFFCVAPGSYYIKIPPSEFGPGSVLAQKLSSSDPTNTSLLPGDGEFR